VLIVDNVTLRIGDRLILDGANAAISDGRKVGLIGRNGAGKSTLLKLILGERDCETGHVEYSKSWRIGAVAQEAPSGPTSLIDTVLAADKERARLLAAAEEEHNESELGEIHARLDDIGAYAAPSRAARILAGLGFGEAEQQRPCEEFSGGWRMRVALGALLFSEPDLLLLDEPTNYLDLEGALWLEDFLKRYRGTVVLVSHDRDLLNRAVDSILHLEHGKLNLYTGGYDIFVETREMKRALAEAQRTQQDAERKRIQAFVDRFRYKASKARQAQSRLKWLEKLKPIAAVVDEHLAPIRLPQPEPAQPPLVALDRVSVGYVPGKPVLSHITLRIDTDDRLALLGSNGNGKSTLAKLLSGRMEPMSGEMARARKCVVGYFAQHQLDELNAERTALQTLIAHRPRLDETRARAQLGGFAFAGEKANTKIAQLSGGERARLLLAIATLDKPNLLILDEPTNHLDIDAREELLTALNEYEGAVVIISHDRRLIEACADRLLLVADGRVTPFDGDLEDYQRMILSKTAEPERTATRDAQSSKAAQRREAAGRRQTLKPLKQAMDKSEREVTALHGDIETIDAQLAAPGLFTKDPAKGEALSKKRSETERALAAAEARWIEAAERYEAAQSASE
jgi:ATP-binding cassette subfamily F protein 3